MDDIKIGIGVSSIGRFLPLVGKAAGPFEKENISVEVVNQQDEEKVVTDIVTQATPVGTPNAPSLIFSLLEGNDLVIVGGGVAGLTAALTSARTGRKTHVLTGPALGGQLISIERVDGYPGFPDGVPGYDLCPIIQEQAATAGAEFASTEATGLRADGAAPERGRWSVKTRQGDVTARAVVIATGTTSKTLGIPGEEPMRGKGVSHCASCDAPLLRGRVVGVVGGGDSALQEALTKALGS